MNKKTEVITFRTDSDTKKQIEDLAKDKEWSVAQVVDKICKEYFREEGQGERN